MSTRGTVLMGVGRKLFAYARTLVGIVPFVVVLWAVPAAAQSGTRTIENIATATYADPEGNPGPLLEARVAFTLSGAVPPPPPPPPPPPNASLELRKSVNHDLVVPGDTLQYVVRWRGLGPGTMRPVTITDALPAGVRLIDGTITASVGQILPSTDGVVRVMIDSVAPNDSGEIRFAAVARGTTGAANNVAQATYLSAGQTVVTPSDTAHTWIESPQLRLTLEALVDRTLHVGDEFTYRLRAFNASSRLTLRDVVIFDTLPPELTEITAQPDWVALQREVVRVGTPTELLADVHDDGSATRAVIQWLFATIAPGDSVEILLRVRVTHVGSGSLVNVANGTASVSTAVTAVATATATAAATITVVPPSGALRVRQTASSLEVASGEAVAYVVTAVNEGNVAIENGELALAFGRGFRVQSATVRGGTIAATSASGLRLDVGAIAAGDSVIIHYAGSVVGARGAQIANVALAAGDADGLPRVVSDSATVTVRVRAGVLESRVAIGRVWLDTDGDGRFNNGERPLAHALLWLSHGQTVRADSLGRFTVPDLEIGRYTLRVDPLSIPADYADPLVRSFRIDGAVAPVLNLALPLTTEARQAVDRSLAAAFLFTETGERLPLPRIATPRDGAIVGTNRLFLRVEGEPATSVVLYHGASIVARETLRPDGSMDFMGLELTPGPNVFRAVFRGSAGEQIIETNVHFSGTPQSLERVGAAPIRAGGTSVIAFTVRDQWQQPVAHRPLATLRASGVRLLDADADEFSVGTQLAVDEQGMLLVRVQGDSAGKAVLQVTLDGIEQDVSFDLLPEIRALMFVGDGEIGVGNTTRSYGSAVARGAIDARTSVTLSYDSRRTRDNAFAGVFDPLDEGRFPVLGDASERTIIGSATVPLSLRVERDQNWVLFGDIVTRSFAEQTSPAYYSRALPGATASWSRGRLAAMGFGSVVGQQLVQKQIRGNGSSGPYDLGGAIRPGTDRLVVETRDRLNASVIIARQELERFVDYDIDPQTGSVLLRRPLLATDPSGNPTLLVAFAERIDGESAFVGGARAVVQLPAAATGMDSLAIGGSVVDDHSTLGGHRIISGDVRATVGRSGARLELVRGERADSSDHALQASAWLGAPTTTGIAVDWTRVGDRFVNPGNSAIMAGITDLRIKGRAQVSDAWSLGAATGVQSFRAMNAERRTTSVTAGRAVGGRQATLDLGYMDERIARDTGAVELASVTSKLSYTAGKATAWVDVLQPLSNASATTRPATYGIGTSYVVWRNVSAELSHRLLRGDSISGGITTFGLRSELPTKTRLWSEYRLGSNVASQQSAVLVGIGQTLRLTPTVSVDGQFERRQGLSSLPLTDPARALPFAQVESDRTTTAFGVEWRPAQADARASLRAELSDGDVEGRGARVLGSVETALNTSWTLLARHDARLQEQRLTERSARTRASRTLLAAAFRPATRSDWNAMAKLERRADQNPQRSAGTILAGSDDRLIGAVEAIWTPDAGRELGLRFALRHARQGGMLAGGSDLTALTNYVGARYVHQVHARADLRVTARHIAESRAQLAHWDVAPAIGLRLIEGLELEAGYRFGDVRDFDFAPNGGRGAYAALGMSVTERTGQRIADFWRTRMERP